jgi:prephenate dehydrogenase
MRVAVLGLGLIGGSVGLAARERGGAHVTGWDPDPAARGAALEHGAADAVAPTPAAALQDAEVAFAASPVDVLGDLVADALRAAGPDCVVSDVGSV